MRMGRYLYSYGVSPCFGEGSGLKLENPQGLLNSWRSPLASVRGAD